MSSSKGYRPSARERQDILATQDAWDEFSKDNRRPNIEDEVIRQMNRIDPIFVLSRGIDSYRSIINLTTSVNPLPNMSTTSAAAQSNATFIDFERDLLPLLDSIANLTVDPPSLYMDLEGIDLGRHGSMSILSLYIAPTQKTYLIDIHRLGSAAFSITNNSGTTLKTVLESSTIPKVVFDIRNDSDALFSLFQISVDGIKDLQLMELASRTGSRKFLSGLSKCIEKERPISPAAKTEWRLTKECGPWLSKLRRPEQAFWRSKVRETTKDRIKLSQSSDYDGKSKRNAFGWSDQTIEDDMESWNDMIMMEALAGQYVMNENDDWVPRYTLKANDEFENFLLEGEEEEHDDDDYNWGNDTARDCIGWEDDMVKNGGFF
ncbi:hypothetical protein EG329_006418 [Mollisiaceae sp. DMI_Dod_QoI]|nr:hypothetical protein EG329_006418 [Helotiales sp. DMI_Dod_QoI]